jgi:uncharacterized iron-regulated membrane protein
MKRNVLMRKIHYWITAFIALPLLVIIGSGLLLQLKKHSDWVQPPEQRGTGTRPAVSIEQILASVSQIENLNVTSWEDVNSLDVRPGKGMVKVRLHSGWEVQVDLGTGGVLQTAYRRSDLIESIHDGSFFAGDISKLVIFLPAGLCLFIMFITGVWLFWARTSNRLHRKKSSAINTAGKRTV